MDGGQKALLLWGQLLVCPDCRLHRPHRHCGMLRAGAAAAGRARLREQRLAGNAECPGDQFEDADGRLVQAALGLAQLGVRQPRHLGRFAKGQVR